MRSSKTKRAGNHSKARSKPLVLAIEPVPESSWFKDLSRVLPLHEWKTIKTRMLQEAGHSCDLCGATGLLRIDAVWEYDTRKRLQTLVDFEVLCELCYQVRHFDLSSRLDEEVRQKKATLVHHFMKVNHCSERTFDAHYKEASQLWRRRSKFTWTGDLSHKKDVLTSQNSDGRVQRKKTTSNWLDRMQQEEEKRVRREEKEAAKLQRFYHKIGLEDRKKRKYYRVPDIRSHSRV